jgi:hypothetical protein
MNLIIVNAVRPYNGPVKSVTFGLCATTSPKALIDMIKHFSNLPPDHGLIYDSLLIQSLVDPYAFQFIENGPTIQGYLNRRSHEMKFKFKFDAIRSSQKVTWPGSFMVDIKYVGPIIVKEVYTLYLNQDVCRVSMGGLNFDDEYD